jgi:hypothetical protein
VIKGCTELICHQNRQMLCSALAHLQSLAVLPSDSTAVIGAQPT